MSNFLKFLAISFVAIVLVQWLTGGHDDVIRPPAQCSESVLSAHENVCGTSGN